MLDADQQVSVIIPAFNEAERIGQTLAALCVQNWVTEMIVVDDGSTDRTAQIARKYTENVYRLKRNRGKAQAIMYGAQQARYETLLFLDADLEHSAAHAERLLKPLREKRAEMSIAVLPTAKRPGFGLVKRFAAWCIQARTKRKLQAPLSGQRAIHKAVFLQCYRGDQRFGLEVGLTLDILAAGYRLEEVEVPFDHRELGRTFHGFLHRFKQGIWVCQSLLARR
jgi:glycosyltransferase involved in cell wall biosynthesis